VEGGEHVTASNCLAPSTTKFSRSGISSTFKLRIPGLSTFYCLRSTAGAFLLRAPRFIRQKIIMSVQLPPATHRKRALPQGELEAASTLKLGADQNTHTLSLSEARLVINKVLENKRRGGKKYEEPEYVALRCPSSFPVTLFSMSFPLQTQG
jgi:hypothetical protein